MFYSHELLRSKEAGVATVWIVATLGPKSAAKKVTRKQILGVDVPKACQKIRTPDAPIALRLQSNLLYGVSRVYVQQCDFVLTDAQQAQSSLRALIRAARQSVIDMEIVKTRPQDLVLEDDPAYYPGATFDLITAMSQFSTEGSSRRSSLLSPHSPLSSATSGQSGDDGSFGLVIPDSPSDTGVPFGALSVPSDEYGSAQRHARMQDLLGEEDPLDLNPGFTVDEEGNLITVEDDNTIQQAPGRRPTGVSLGDDSADLALVREALQAAQRQRTEPMDVDFNQGFGGIEDDAIMPDAEAFPPMAAALHEAEQPSSENAQAPQQRKPRANAFITFDKRIQLPAAELNAWNNDYVANMRNATKDKRTKRAPWLAKENAADWTFGRGIGDIGQHPAILHGQHPLAMFVGANLQEALIGGEKRKRGRGEGQESGSDDRRLRSWIGEEELGRGDNMVIHDDVGMAVTPEGVEQARGPEPPLEDFSTQYPWSNMGSRQGSIPSWRPFQSSVGGLASSAARRSSTVPGPLERRGSLLTSASPLVGRGQHERYSSLELPMQEGEGNLPFGEGSSALGDDDNFELYGPAAGVTTQTAAESQWIRAALDAESNNFLEFVKVQVAERFGALEEEDELAAEPDQDRSISFEVLLPPTQHTKIVAAQALHHILALATKGLLNVQQDEGYETINLRLPAMI